MNSIKLLVARVEVSWVLIPCSFVVGYQGFGGPCCLHLQGGRKFLDKRSIHQLLKKILNHRVKWHYVLYGLITL